MKSGEPRRSAGLDACQEGPRRTGLLCPLLPCDGACRGWTDEGYRRRWQRNIVEAAEVAALKVVIAMALAIVSLRRDLAP
jgi:hypothetical protein